MCIPYHGDARQDAVLVDPLYWPAPEPDRTGTVGGVAEWVRCRLCPVPSWLDLNQDFAHTVEIIRDYHRHYYRDHAYRNWSA